MNFLPVVKLSTHLQARQIPAMPKVQQEERGCEEGEDASAMAPEVPWPLRHSSTNPESAPG